MLFDALNLKPTCPVQSLDLKLHQITRQRRIKIVDGHRFAIQLTFSYDMLVMPMGLVDTQGRANVKEVGSKAKASLE
jgi:hypothetical protein